MNGPVCRPDHQAHEPTRAERYPYPASYVTMPARLLDDLRDSATAVGVYGLIARLYLIYQAPIPLSTPDIQRYDPGLSRGAAIRALQRLLRGGWLIETKQSGHKTSYIPAWGLIGGAPRAWAHDRPALGRPRHVHSLRLDRRLLDTCLGKLTPHHSHSAQVERYLTEPMLGLADVGAYALALADHRVSAPALVRYALLGDDGVRPLPSDQDLLALASQRALFEDHGPALHRRGLAKLGCLPAPEAPSADHSQPIFFVPKAMIGSMIGSMIDAMIEIEPDHNAAHIPSERPMIAASAAEIRSTATQIDQSGSIHPPLHPPTELAGGSRQRSKAGTDQRGRARTRQIESQVLPLPPTELHAVAPARPEKVSSTSISRKPAVRPSGKEPAPAEGEPALAAEPPAGRKSQRHDPGLETPAAQLLRSLNVRPSVVSELAEVPRELVEAALADGLARPEVRDLAGWVVAMVRDAHAGGWRVPAVDSGAEHLTAGERAMQARVARMKASGLFRSDDDLVGLVPPAPTHEPTAGERAMQDPAQAALPTWSSTAGQLPQEAGLALVVPAEPPAVRVPATQRRQDGGLLSADSVELSSEPTPVTTDHIAADTAQQSTEPESFGSSSYVEQLKDCSLSHSPASGVIKRVTDAVLHGERVCEADQAGVDSAALDAAEPRYDPGALQLLAELRRRVRPNLWPLLDSLSLVQRQGELILRCPERGNLGIIQAQLLPILRTLALRLGGVQAPKVTLLLAS